MIFALSSTDMTRLGMTPVRTVFNAAGQNVTLSRSDPSLNYIQSGQSTMDIITQNRERTRATSLLSSQTQDLIHKNLVGLGEASIDISAALNRQIGIREDQRGETFSIIDKLTDYISEVNNRLSTQTTELGESVSDVSQAIATEEVMKEGASWFPEIKLPTFDQLRTPLIIAGAAIAALIILPRVITSGFKF